jgi:rusticyanin
MGGLFANAPGPRVSAAQATRLGDTIPGGANVDASKNRITLTGSTVHLVVLAGPPGAPNETFRSSGLVNPTIDVQTGAHIWIEVVNADPDAADGLVVTSARSSSSSWMPMMTGGPAFKGSAMWFLGNPTSAGLHVGTINFIAATPGTYQYLCAVPGHAQKGMVGNFVVTN